MMESEGTTQIQRSASQELVFAEAKRKLMNLERTLKVAVHKNESSLASSRVNKPNSSSILQLEQAKANIVSSLRIVSAPLYLKQDKKKQYELQGILANMDRLDLEILQITEQTQQIKEDQKAILKIQSNFKKVVQTTDLTGRILLRRNLKIDRLENDLERITCDKNVILKDNVILRAKITELLRDTFKIFTHKRSTHKKIGEKRKKGFELTDEANEYIDSCFEGMKQTNFIRNMNDKQNSEYRMALWEYEMQMYHDAHLYEFYGRKIVPRSIIENEDDRLNRLKSEELQMYEFRAEKARANLQTLQPFVDDENDDVLSIILKFEMIEHSNFSLFRLITERNAQTEQIQRKITEMKLNIEEEREKKLKAREHVETSLEHLKATIAYQEEAFGVEEMKHKIYEESTVALVKCIKNVVDLTAAIGKNPLLSYLGHRKERIDQKTMELMLNILEHSIADLLFQKSCLKLRYAVEIKGESLPSLKTFVNDRDAKPKSRGGPFQPHITMMSHLPHADLDDVNATLLPPEKPIPFKEMREQLLHEFHDTQNDGSNREMASFIVGTANNK